MNIWCRCSGRRFISGIHFLSEVKKDVIRELGFGGLLQLGCIPHSGRKLIVDKRTVKASQMPSLQDIESMMVGIDDIEEFKRVFLIFTCATLLAPTSRLEGNDFFGQATHKVGVGNAWRFGKVELVSTSTEQDETEKNKAPAVDDPVDPDENEDFDVICARMEATQHQITDAQSHLNSLIASYNHDMKVLRTRFTSSHYRTDEGQPLNCHEHVNESGAPFYTNNPQHSPVHFGG
ncbi:hypothetical protein CK203_024975 [Vitis vinifera]|uniref:Uncharacterized protein n=1 Tax=Vitis vinifera TaxID=29760 RepID=A0A438J791_VITVI|nr:hypothetical protein CK203_024975 [Vitis vinifera]